MPGGAGGAGGFGGGGTGKPVPVEEFARKPADERAKTRGAYADKEATEAKKLATGNGKGGKDPKSTSKDDAAKGWREAGDKKGAYDKARELLKRRDKEGVTTGKLGVDLAVEVNNLRTLTLMERSAVRNVLGRNCMEVGGVWIDNGFTAKTAAVVVKAHSDAYFRILEKHPEVKRVFQLGNYLVWVAPSGKALVIDAANGKDKLTDAEIEALFAKKK
jgi:Ca-activated chloride channel family protein